MTTTQRHALKHLSTVSVVWVRLASVLDHHGREKTHSLEVTTGAPPPDWTPRTWRYPTAAFAAFEASGELMRSCLQGRAIQLGGRPVALPQLADSVRWDRVQSGADTYGSLRWPALVADLAWSTDVRSTPWGHLVSEDDAPSFKSFEVAANCFFGRDRNFVGWTRDRVTYRQHDLRGRIDAVRITDETVEVDFAGDALDGMSVELAGDSPGLRRSITEPPGPTGTTVEFNVPDGLPPGAWVLLHAGGEWIDRRFLAGQWKGNVPTDEETRIALELSVRPGTGLYMCGPPNEAGTVFIRHHATTVRARPTEIERIVRSRTSAPPSASWTP